MALQESAKAYLVGLFRGHQPGSNTRKEGNYNAQRHYISKKNKRKNSEKSWRHVINDLENVLENVSDFPESAHT